MHKCPTCLKEFGKKQGMCSHHAQAHGESLVERKGCETCGKGFPNYEGDRRFCSKKCAGVYFKKKYEMGKKAICETCRKEFHISPSHPRRFCSRECYRNSMKIIPIDKARFFALLQTRSATLSPRASPYGTGTLAKAAKVHPDEIQKLIALGKGRFPLVRKLEAIIGDFRL